MADSESVKIALAELRDVAGNQANAERADLRPVAEAYNKFNEEWVSLREDELRREENPDEDPANAEEIDSRETVVDENGDSRLVEANEKVEEVPAEEPKPAPRSKKSS